jgi:hypothetical protein
MGSLLPQISGISKTSGPFAAGNTLFQISMVVFAGACWKLMRVDYIAIVCGVVQTPSTHLAGVHHKGFPQCFFQVVSKKNKRTCH